MRLQRSRQMAEGPVPGGSGTAKLEPFTGFDDEARERHRLRRERLLERIGDGVAIVPAAPIRYRSRDTEYRFRQDPDFYYLTGFDEPEAVAILTPHDPEHRFTLFVRNRNPEREVWDGPRAGVEGALATYRATAAYPIGELADHLRDLVEPADRIFCALGANPELDGVVIDLIRGFRRSRARSGRGPTTVADPGALLGEMRVVKEPFEIECMRAAAKITAAGHAAAMRRARPDAGEWEIEAALESAFRNGGAAGPAFPSIVASGVNATVLHYVRNDRRCRKGELVLIDAGAEWRMYCADITRTFPVGGRFSPEQRAVYDLVLEAEEAAIAAVAPGAPFTGIHEAALAVLIPGMIRLGLLEGEVEELKESGGFRRFYMHQTSHWLGLDVHDVGLYANRGEPVTLRPGMVLTVEPGIYIPADADDVPAKLRGIGVRIEDNVLVTASGAEILTRDVPVEPEEIERMVGG